MVETHMGNAAASPEHPAHARRTNQRQALRPMRFSATAPAFTAATYRASVRQTPRPTQPVAAIALVVTLFAAALFAFTGCTAQPAADSGTTDIPPSPYSQGTDAPEQSPSSPSGASSFAANLPDMQIAASIQPLSIQESGWWAKDGYVHYGITVHNPNDAAAANAVLRVTLYDAQDAEIGTYERTIALVCAGETIGFAGEAGNGLAPSRVEFNINGASTTWKDGETASNPFTIENFAEQDKLYFRYEITGNITNASNAYESTANLSVLLRDGSGAIVAGYTGSAYRIKAQRTKDFLVTLHSAPDHATAEVYAQPT